MTHSLAAADLPSSSAAAGPSSLVEEVERKLTTLLPCRPGFGTLGTRMIVRANYLVASVKNDLCCYHVSITPEVTSRAVNRSIFKELVARYGDSHLAKLQPAYDGRSNLYTCCELPFTSKAFVVKLRNKDQTSSSRGEKEYKVVINFVSRRDLHHLQEFLMGQQLDAPQETIQILNVVLRESPWTNYTTVARSFFSLNFGQQDIGEGLECWRGYHQSLRSTQMGLSLNIDISPTSFYKAMPVLDFVAEYLNLRDVSSPLRDNERTKVSDALIGIRVETTHNKGSVRRYRIKGLTPEPLSQLMFNPVEGQATRISVIQYFREQYNYHLRHVNWPCLVSGDKRPTYLPMEVSKIVEGQRFASKLSDRQVIAILRATCKRPSEREKSISKDTHANEFGIQVANQLAHVHARVLTPPKLKYHESGIEKLCNPSVGWWNMINKRMVNGGTVETWTCLNLSRLGGEVHQFCQDIVSVCNNLGMRFNPSPLVPPRHCHPDNIEAALKEIHNKSTEALANQGVNAKYLQLLLVILPETNAPYGKIKCICETELGIVSQCFLPEYVKRCDKQYLENVSLKINVKVGGINTVLEDVPHTKALPNVNDKPTIIFGADVTHLALGDDSSSSIAAVVASMDWPQVTKYRALVSAQPRREEILQDLFTETHDPMRGTL